MIKPRTLDGYRLLHDGTLAFARAEQAGLRIDVEYCTRKIAFLDRKIAKLNRDFESTNFYKHWRKVFGKKTNVGSDDQLAHILYNIKKLSPQKTTGGGRGSTDVETLTQLGIQELDLRIQSGKLEKIKSTYLANFVAEQVDGVLHPFFNLNTARTFRSSSSAPNFQNIPKRDEEAMNICRRAIFPRKGHMLGEVDYAGIEVRIGICWHHDPVMRAYIEDPASDMHGDMAKEILLITDFDKKNPHHAYLRGAIKNGFVFPQFYGSYYVNCANTILRQWGKLPKGPWQKGMGVPLNDAFLSDHLISQGIKSYEEFEEHLGQVEYNFWNKRFKAYKEWKDDFFEVYQRKGYFDLYTGFRCSGLMKKNDTSNYPIQGCAFHCLLWSFIKLDQIQREEKWETRLVGQIHDAIILDIEPSELDYVMKTVRRVTCIDLPKAWNWIIVPLDIEAEVCPVDRPWNEKKKYSLAS